MNIFTHVKIVFIQCEVKMTGLIVVVVLVCDLQSATWETVRSTRNGHMTLGDHVANESHSLCVGTLSHARRILQSHHIGSFSSHHPPLSTSIVRILLTMLLLCIVCIHSTPDSS